MAVYSKYNPMYTDEDIFSLMEDLEGVGLSETPDEFSLRILTEYIQHSKANPCEGTYYYTPLPASVGTVYYMDIYRRRFEHFMGFLATKNIVPTYYILQCRLRHVQGWPLYYLTLPMIRGKVIDIFNCISFRWAKADEIKFMILDKEDVLSTNVFDYWPEEETPTFEPFKVAHKITFRQKPL